MKGRQAMDRGIDINPDHLVEILNQQLAESNLEAARWKAAAMTLLDEKQAALTAPEVESEGGPSVQ